MTYEQHTGCSATGRDYMAAEHSDRANMLTNFTPTERISRQALAALQIYQLTSDWQKAIESRRTADETGQTKQRIEIARTAL